MRDNGATEQCAGSVSWQLIYDVASKAGVSISTVSRLYAPGTREQQTLSKVLAAANDLDYSITRRHHHEDRPIVPHRPAAERRRLDVVQLVADRWHRCGAASRRL
ncbi:MAG: LacI family DNA-binding transcriptional regulator [Bifidobacterium breve]